MSTTLRAGVCIGRKELSLAVIGRSGRKYAVAFQRRLSRATGNILSEDLKLLFKDLSADATFARIAIALSPSLLACADCFSVPCASEQQLERIKGSLAEGRCCGETAEELAIDFLQVSSHSKESIVELVAARRELIHAICEDVKNASSAPIVLVTATPVALAHAILLKEGTFAAMMEGNGEAVVLQMRSGLPVAWRAFPVDASTQQSGENHKQSCLDGDTVELKNGVCVQLPIACAAAVAMLDVEDSVNLLRAVSDAPQTLAAKLRRPLLRALGAAALLCLTLGLYFNKKATILTHDLAQSEKVERQMAERFLRDQSEASALSIKQRVQRALADYSHDRDLNQAPSALSFWSELGSHLPSADRIGLTLESLQLGSESGRLIARVNTTPEDPLANAALLERSLNSSNVLAARGEFETKSSEVAVRLKLDYRPRVNPSKEALAP